MKTDAHARAYGAFFESLTPGALARLEDVFVAEARFKDPFNDARGVDAIRRVFEHMYRTAERPRFEVLDMACEGDVAYLRWIFRFALPKKPQEEHAIEGVSRVVFAEDGRAIEHVDYWDPAGNLYEALPVLGWMFRRLRKALSA